MYTCEKCGHEDNKSILRVGQIEGWEEGVPSDWVTALKTPFKQVTGVTEQGYPYRTLYLSTVIRQTLFEAMDGKAPTSVLEKWRSTIVPTIERLAVHGIKPLGAISPPCHMAMAITNLTQPRVVFAFVAVWDDPFLLDKLHLLGFDSLLNEGAVNTIGGPDWFDVADDVAIKAQ